LVKYVPKLKVYVTREIPERGLRAIKERFDAEVWPEYAPPPKKVIIDKVRDVDALVPLLSDKIDAEVFDAGPKLKIVAQMAVGFDNISLKEATKRGIYVTNTPGVLTETTADFAWALLMAMARRVVEADKYVHEGQWNVGWHPSMLLGRDIYGATIGIVGAGRIGAAIASERLQHEDSVLRCCAKTRIGKTGSEARGFRDALERIRLRQRSRPTVEGDSPFDK